MKTERTTFAGDYGLSIDPDGAIAIYRRKPDRTWAMLPAGQDAEGCMIAMTMEVKRLREALAEIYSGYAVDPQNYARSVLVAGGVDPADD